MKVRCAWASPVVLVGVCIAGAAFGQDAKPDEAKASEPAAAAALTIPTMDDLAWIAGDWVSTNEDLRYTITETWSAPFHDTMTGVARTVVIRPGEDGGPAKGEVVSVRSMVIRPRPDGLPVLFMRRMTGVLEDYPGLGAAFYPLSEWGTDRVTFANEDFESPRSITFDRNGADALRITYTGLHAGTGQLHAQETDFRARHAVEPGSPLIARAILFRSLLHAGDYDGARAMMSDDPRRWWGSREGEGRAWKIGPASGGGPWHDWDEHFRSRTEIVDWTATDESAGLTFRETNDYFRLLDRGWTTSRVTYFFDDEKRISGWLVEAIGERPPGRTEEFLAWARENRPDEIEALMPDGEVDPSGENGDHPQRMRALLVEWRAAAGLPPLQP